MTLTTSAPNTISRISTPMCASSAYARAMAVRAMRRVANDNEGQDSIDHRISPAAQNMGKHGLASADPMLRAALRHFAQHGLGAAREARMRAESAFFEGDRAGYDWWLGITRTLDRRLASEAVPTNPRPTLEIL